MQNKLISSRVKYTNSWFICHRSAAPGDASRAVTGAASRRARRLVGREGEPTRSGTAVNPKGFRMNRITLRPAQARLFVLDNAAHCDYLMSSRDRRSSSHTGVATPSPERSCH